MGEVNVPAPEIGLPEGIKERRVDFADKKFDVLIETKAPRIAWSRTMACPCIGINDQTQQPDPNCDLCKNTPGFLFFRPTDYASDPTLEGDLTDVQQYIVDRAESESVIIKGVIQSNQKRDEQFNTIGHWVDGSSLITVREENRLGYYDRIVFLDSLIAYSQIAFTDGMDITKLRFPAVQVNFLRDKTTIYKEGTDFECTSQGEIRFTGATPADKTKLAVHYLHPYLSKQK